MVSRFVPFASAAALGLVLTVAQAFAAGEPPAPTTDTPKPAVETCKAGEIYDQTAKKCVKPAPTTDRQSLYEAGRDLATAEKYEEAIAVLEVSEDKGDARILNYLGYSHRKLGHLMIALGYYEEAVKADPKYTLVREYLGEAHVQMGNFDAAREQLSELEKLCGTDCREYTMLAGSIEKATVKN